MHKINIRREEFSGYKNIDFLILLEPDKRNYNNIIKHINFCINILEDKNNKMYKQINKSIFSKKIKNLIEQNVKFFIKYLKWIKNNKNKKDFDNFYELNGNIIFNFEKKMEKLRLDLYKYVKYYTYKYNYFPTTLNMLVFIIPAFLQDLYTLGRINKIYQKNIIVLAGSIHILNLARNLSFLDYKFENYPHLNYVKCHDLSNF